VDEAFSNLVREIRKYNKVTVFLIVVPSLGYFEIDALSLACIFRNSKEDDQRCPIRDLSPQGCTANRVAQMTTLAVAVAVVSFFSLGSHVVKLVGKLSFL